MKLGFFFLTFGKNIFAGMENAAFDLVKGLIETGHEVAVFTSHAYGSESSIDGITIHRTTHLPTNYSGGDSAIENYLRHMSPKLTEDIRAFINIESPEVMIVWDPLWGFVQYLEKALPIPTILVFHVLNKATIIEMVNNYPYKKVFAVSNYLRERLLAHGVIHQIDILPNSIDIDFFRNSKKDAYLKSKAILCNARLSPEKGIEYAVQGFATFLEMYPDYRLWLCSGAFPFGDVNVTRNEIEKMVRNLGITNHVDFLPNISWSRIPQTVTSARAVILPSLMESFGIAALETMAAGVPLISTNVGNLPDLVGNCGLIVPPKSSLAIADALKRIVEDVNLSRSLSKDAIEQARKYDRKTVAKQLTKEIQGIL